MISEMITENIGFFIYTFTSVFVVVSPVSAVVTFISLTSKMTHDLANLLDFYGE